MNAIAHKDPAPVGVLQLVDTLNTGGLERLARDLANLLPRAQVRPHLCATRSMGPGTGDLAAGIADDVNTLHLARRYRFDLPALRRLARWVRRHNIRLIHAHGHAVHAALVATAMNPRAAVVWHLHSGAWAEIRKPGWAMRFAAQRVAHVFTVTEALADWCQDRLGIDHDRVEYVPNFLAPEPAVTPSEASQESTGDPGLELPGKSGKRLVCVANLRPEKDLPNLVAGMRRAVRQDDALHLLLVGTGPEDARRALEHAIHDAGLAAHITMLGHRADVLTILRASDAAILASRSEGFPLVLLEYGAAGLPTIATRVGQCAEILDQGHAGILVEHGDPSALGSAILRVFEPASRSLGGHLQERVSTHYAAAAILERITARYLHIARPI